MGIPLIKNRLRKAISLGFTKTTQRILDKTKKKFNILLHVPPTVYIELTDICNLDCVMCDGSGMTRKSGLMSMELFKKIIDNAAEIKVPAVKLNRFPVQVLQVLNESGRYNTCKSFMIALSLLRIFNIKIYWEFNEYYE